MRLSEDVIRYMTVKQEGPLPMPKPSNKSTTQKENKDNIETKVGSKESQPVTTPEVEASGKDNTAAKLESQESEPVTTPAASTSGEDNSETNENIKS